MEAITLILGWIGEHWGGLAAGAACVASLINGRKIMQVRVEIDGRLTQLLALTTVAARAEGDLAGMERGKLAGVAQEKQAQSDRDATPVIVKPVIINPPQEVKK